VRRQKRNRPLPAPSTLPHSSDDTQNLARHLIGLGLSQDAVEWLLSLWRLIHVFDDFADGETVSRETLDAAINDALWRMPANAFFQEHQSWLIPSMMQATLKWMASDIAERDGKADARSFMWRAGFYDLICTCVSLELGPSSEQAYRALSLYGESFYDYLKEFE